MAELNTWQNWIFRIGAIALIAGLAGKLFLVPGSCWLVAAGVVMFVSMQMLVRYDGSNFVLQRLRRQQLFSDFVFLLMAALLVLQDNNWGPAMVKGNVWTLCLVIASLLQIYTAFRIPQELERRSTGKR